MTDVNLTAVSASGNAQTITSEIDISLVTISASAAVNPLIVNENDLPVFTLMRTTPVAANGNMGVNA